MGGGGVGGGCIKKRQWEWGGEGVDLREKVENGEEEVKECPSPDGVVI